MYAVSPRSTPMFNMNLYLCVLTFVLTIVYIIDLCMCIYIMIICMFMSLFYPSCFDYMFRCQFSLKLRYILIQLVSQKQIIICLCLNAHLYPLDALVQPSFDDSYILTCILYFCTYFHDDMFQLHVYVKLFKTIGYTCILLSHFAFHANSYYRLI